MKVELSQAALPEVEADFLVVGLYDGGELPKEIASAPGAADAAGAYKKLTVLHPERPSRVLVVGLGKRGPGSRRRWRPARRSA